MKIYVTAVPWLGLVHYNISCRIHHYHPLLDFGIWRISHVCQLHGSWRDTSPTLHWWWVHSFDGESIGIICTSSTVWWIDCQITLWSNISLTCTIIGIILSRIPLRVRQFVLLETFFAVYLLWTVIHACTRIGNPDRDDGDSIYHSLKWKSNTVRSVILACCVLLVVNPLAFLICRAISRLFPRRIRGSMSTDGQTTLKGRRFDEEEAVFVYEVAGPLQPGDM